MSRLAPLLLAALLVAPCPADAAEDEGEDVTEPLPWREDAETIYQDRIVEAATGKPVAGAVVRLYAEDQIPVPGFGSPMATVKSDPGGWVRVHRADLDARLVEEFGDPVWAYAEAPGLGPNGEYGLYARDSVLELDRASPLHFSIRDPIGRPVPDARIGWFVGCGHMPDLRTARTGPDGIARLEGVSTDHSVEMWFDGTGFTSTYVEDGWRAWQRPIVTTVEWGEVFEGTILTSDGKPAAGVAVGAPLAHRGPWTRTDAHGEFRLIGSDRDAGDDIEVRFDPQADDTPTGVRSSLTFPAPPKGHRSIVRLPAPGATIKRPTTTRLVVEPEINWPSSKDEPEIRVIAVRTDDGWTTTGATGSQRVALLDVRPGAYDVYAEVRREGCSLICSRGRAIVNVPAGIGAWVPMELPAPAFLPIVCELAPDKWFQLQVLTEGETATVRLEDDQARVEVWVPTDRPLYVRASRDERIHVTAVDQKGLVPYERAPEVIVPTFPSIEVRARFVDDRGSPAEGWLRDLATASQWNDPQEFRGAASSETPSVTVAADDHFSLVAWPKDEVRFQPSIVEVKASRSGGDPIVLGDIRLKARTPVLNLLDPDGKPCETGRFLVTRGERTKELRPWITTPVVDPWLEPGLLGEGTIVRGSVGGGNEVPYVRRLEGAGPWTVRAPKGSLTIEARGYDDAPIKKWHAHLDGFRYHRDGASLQLTTVDAGPHEVIVEAEGRTPRRLRFTLADGEQRTWIARLSPRPSGPR